MKKVKEWLFNKKNPQFKVLLLAEGRIHVVERLRDKLQFIKGHHYRSAGDGHVFINSFDEDCIHLEYVINPGVKRGICEINQIITGQSLDGNTLIMIGENTKTTISEPDTSKCYSD